MYSSTMQCDPSDRDRDLACCWLKQKKVSDFPDFKGVSIPVKYARVLRWHTRHGHLQVRCLTRGLRLALYINMCNSITMKDAESGNINAWTL